MVGCADTKQETQVYLPTYDSICKICRFLYLNPIENMWMFDVYLSRMYCEVLAMIADSSGWILTFNPYKSNLKLKSQPQSN